MLHLPTAPSTRVATLRSPKNRCLLFVRTSRLVVHSIPFRGGVRKDLVSGCIYKHRLKDFLIAGTKRLGNVHKKCRLRNLTVPAFTNCSIVPRTFRYFLSDVPYLWSLEDSGSARRRKQSWTERC